MTLSHWQRSHTFTSSDVQTDIVILGGGYVGLATAYWLTELRPDLKITIVERNQCGAGASGRNAGFLTKGSAYFYKALTDKWGFDKAQSIFTFAEKSIEMVYQNILKSCPEIDYDQVSSYTLIRPDAFDLSSVSGFAFNWQEASELHAKLGKNYQGVLVTAPEYRVNPMDLLGTLKKKLLSRKVQILEGISAFEIGEGMVKTDVNLIKTQKVIVALNGYTSDFHSAFNGIIRPTRAQMLAVELDENLDIPGLFYDPPEKVYWRKAQDKVLVIGGKRLLEETGEQGSSSEKLSANIQTGLESYLSDVLEVKYKVISRWSGIMGYTNHELPYLQKIKAPSETYLVGGFSGHGMGFGFHAARETAELALGLREKSFFSEFGEVKVEL